ncbi:MAG: D-glycero-beta-D-manno-heptose-7-phosphate kinase [Elusimicrobiota bacterium]
MPQPLPAAERKFLRHLVAQFAGKRILVIGDVMLDHYIRGSVSRISPEAPVPVVHVQEETFVPGGGGNVSANLSSLQAVVDLMAVVGADEAGRSLIAELQKRGIMTANVIGDSDRVTSQKCRVVAERQQVVRYDRESAGYLSAATERNILARLPNAVKSAHAVVLSDYGKGVVSPKISALAIALARQHSIPITVDPKIEHFKRYRRVTCITPNLHEAWNGMHRTPKLGEMEIERLGRDILRLLKSQSVLITRSADGMSLFESSGKTTHIPTNAREVYDVTGAGDTVIAALTLALACGATVKRAAEISNYAAGIVVGKLGTAVTTIKEIQGAIQ